MSSNCGGIQKHPEVWLLLLRGFICDSEVDLLDKLIFVLCVLYAVMKRGQAEMTSVVLEDGCRFREMLASHFDEHASIFHGMGRLADNTCLHNSSLRRQEYQ